MRTEIVYEDRELLVIWKPAGLATQTARVGQADVVSELKNYLAGASGSRPYLGIIHRLDQPVEGLLVFAKSRQAAAALTRQLAGEEEALLNKQYYAVICGRLSPPEGKLIDYLKKGADGRAEVWTSEKDPPGKEFRRAVLRYRLLQTAEILPGREFSLAEIELETGRFHQIRAQMAKAGTPLLGDFKYGGEECRSWGEALGVRTASLCAGRIVLTHPFTGKSMSFERKPAGKAFSCFEI